MEVRLTICPTIDFREVWEKCLTKPFDFTQVMKHDTLEELESLRMLSAKRANALENRALGDKTLQERKDGCLSFANSTSRETLIPVVLFVRIEDYLFHLIDLKAKVQHLICQA